MIVDPQKLERVRDVVDLSVVEAALSQNLARSAATCYVANSLGYRIRLLLVGQRWIAYAVPGEAWERAAGLAGRGNAIQAAGTELLERLPWHYESTRIDEAMLAVVCRLLDSGVDLGKSVTRAGQPPAGGGVDHRGETPMSRWFGPVRDQWSAIGNSLKPADSPGERRQPLGQGH